MKVHSPAVLGALALLVFASTAVVTELPVRPTLKRAETAAMAAVTPASPGADTTLLWRWETPFPGSHPFGPLPH